MFDQEGRLVDLIQMYIVCGVYTEDHVNASEWKASGQISKREKAFFISEKSSKKLDRK